MKKTILIHTLVFPPDQVSTSYLYGDIALSLLEKGYNITVITTFPHYNYSGSFSEESVRQGIWRVTDYFGIKVYHFPQKKSSNIFYRGFYILFFHLAFCWKFLFLKNISLVLTPSPPLTSGFISGIMSRVKNVKSIYNVQEIYPDVLVSPKINEKSLIIRFLRLIEKKTYKYSDKVVVIDDLFAKQIQSRTSDDKLIVIPNFIDTELYKPSNSPFVKDLVFEGKYVVGYIGNLGKVQDWDLVLRAINSLKNESNIHFLIVGGGSEYERLNAEQKKLNNLTVISYQERDLISKIYNRLDLHFIAMDTASDKTGLPSKVYAILSTGTPILAVTSLDSPLASVIRESGNGVIVPLGEIDSFKNQLIKASKGKLFNNNSNKAGRDYIVNKYSKKIIMDKYLSLVESLI